MKTLATLLLNIFRGYERKHLQLIAAGLAYYFVMSLFPALVLVTALAAYLPIKNSSQRATSFIAHFIPHQHLSVVEPIVTSITVHRSGLLWLGIVSTLWLTSVGAQAIIQGLDLVYEVHTPRSLWMNRFVAFLLTLAVGVLLILAVLLTLVGPIAENVLAIVTPLQYAWIRIWPVLQWLLAATFTFAAIEFLYLLAPNISARKRVTIPGAIIAAAAWLVLAWLLGVFFDEFAKSTLSAMYGVFATPIALLTWLKWGATAILLGAETNVRLQSNQSFTGAGVAKKWQSGSSEAA
jgi:membrane protein